MSALHISLRFCFLMGFLLFGTFSRGQKAVLDIDQDPQIEKLLTLKTKLNRSTKWQSEYKIQVFSGDYEKAEKVFNKVKTQFRNLRSKLEFETPNFKVRLGSFESRLEADKRLVKIRKKYPEAILIKPQRPKRKKKEE